MRNQSGLTLIEAIMVMAVLAVLAAVAVPNYLSWLPDYRIRSAARDLFSNFQKAKLTAIQRNMNTVVCFHDGGYIMFLDADLDFKKDGSEETLTQVIWDDYKSVQVNPQAITFDKSSGQPCIAFCPTGIPSDNGGGFASGTAPISNTNDRIIKVIISQAGHIRIQQ